MREDAKAETANTEIQVGAERTALYFPFLKGKKIGMVVNQTSKIGSVHLVDSLLHAGFNVVKILAPEHGFRGHADAGATVRDQVDLKTGLPIYSLYGSQKEMTADQLNGLDLVIFDIQDVGARFYTYISTMHYVMEACARYQKELLILDRPNPNGHYIDGPILEETQRSFVGMHTIPVVHGLTIAELAQMIKGEEWLKTRNEFEMKLIPCANYDHRSPYILPVPPSPNLPNQRAIYLYPSLCFFEGTTVSIGRGTSFPFQVIGHPGFTDTSFSFTPVSGYGSKYPKWENRACYGHSFQEISLDTLYQQKRIDLGPLIRMYKALKEEPYFLKNRFIDKLAGTSSLRESIIRGDSESAIRATWETALKDYAVRRQKYLLYRE